MGKKSLYFREMVITHDIEQEMRNLFKREIKGY